MCMCIIFWHNNFKKGKRKIYYGKNIVFNKYVFSHCLKGESTENLLTSIVMYIIYRHSLYSAWCTKDLLNLLLILFKNILNHQLSVPGLGSAGGASPPGGRQHQVGVSTGWWGAEGGESGVGGESAP